MENDTVVRWVKRLLYALSISFALSFASVWAFLDGYAPDWVYSSVTAFARNVTDSHVVVSSAEGESSKAKKEQKEAQKKYDKAKRERDLAKKQYDGANKELDRLKKNKAPKASINSQKKTVKKRKAELDKKESSLETARQNLEVKKSRTAKKAKKVEDAKKQAKKDEKASFNEMNGKPLDEGLDEIDNEGASQSSKDSKDSKDGSSSSSSKGKKKKAKSKEEKNPKKGKKTPTYSGGTKQGVNKDPIERQYVKDDRRSPTDAIRFMSADPATAALMENVMGKINATVGGKYLVVYSSDGMFSFSSKIYKPLTDKEKDYIMEVALKTVKESRLPKKVGAKVSAFIAEQDKGRAAAIQALNSDVSSELSTGYAWFKPFASPISTALGFLAIIIFVFFTASITFDVAYLTIGLVRQFLDNSSEGRPRFVTGEAMETAKEVDGYVQSGSYRAYVAVYFRRRMGIFFLTSILLIWLISGQIYEMFTWAFEIFEEIFNIRG